MTVCLTKLTVEDKIMPIDEKETEDTLARVRAITEEFRKREERLKSKYKDFLRGCDVSEHHYLPPFERESPDKQRTYLDRAAEELGIGLRHLDGPGLGGPGDWGIWFQVHPPIQQELQKMIETLRERGLPTDRLEKELEQES